MITLEEVDEVVDEEPMADDGLAEEPMVDDESTEEPVVEDALSEEEVLLSPPLESEFELLSWPVELPLQATRESDKAPQSKMQINFFIVYLCK